MYESQFSQKTEFKVKRSWHDHEEDPRKAYFKIEYKNHKTGQNYDYEYEF